MAVWKKLNSDTGEYDVIPGASCNTNSNNTEDSAGTLPDLTGKTAIFMGDSYTVQMSAMLKSMCAEFGMVDDNRGRFPPLFVAQIQEVRELLPCGVAPSQYVRHSPPLEQPMMWR